MNLILGWYLYYADEEDSYIEKKVAQKLWEYLHKNRKDLYIFKQNLEANQKNLYLSNIEFFKEHLKNSFAHKKIVELKKGDRVVEISLFPNGKLYDMSGESLGYEEMEKIWGIVFDLAKEGKLEVLEKKELG